MAPVEHPGQDGTREHHGAQEIDPDHPDDVVGVAASQRTRPIDPSVVNQHIDLPERGESPLDEPGHLVGVGDVDGNRNRLARVGLYRPGLRFQLGAPPGGEHDVRSPRGQHSGGDGADARAGARHDRHLSDQRFGHRFHLSPATHSTAGVVARADVVPDGLRCRYHRAASRTPSRSPTHGL